jgi:Flp pilus assembly protein TadD
MLMNRIRAHLGFGQFEEAIADCSKFIELAPNDPEVVLAYLFRARARARLGRIGQARAEYEQIMKRAPRDARPCVELAWVLATCSGPARRDPKTAVELAGRAVKLAPPDGSAWQALGLAHYRAGDSKAAIAALEKSQELRGGGDVVDWLLLAMAQWKLGRHAQARRRYDRAVRWLQKNPKAPIVTPQVREFRAEAEEVLGLKKQ